MAKKKLNNALIKKVEAMKLLDMKNKDIAIQLGISEKTFYQWRNKGKENIESESRINLYGKFFNILRESDIKYKFKLLKEFHSALYAKGDTKTMLELLRSKYPGEFERVKEFRVEHDIAPRFADIEEDMDDVMNNDLEIMKSIIVDRDSKMGIRLAQRREKKKRDSEMVKDLKFDD